MLEVLSELDTTLFTLINGTLGNRVFDLLMPVLTDQKNWYVPILMLWLGLMIWGGRKGRITALLVIPLLVMTDQASSHLLKPLIGRVRPCNVLGGVHLYRNGGWVLTPETATILFKRSLSFPSSHATNLFGAATLLSYAYRKWTPVCLLLAVSIGYSRVYVGVHYPSDVLGGALLGTGCALLFIWGWRTWTRHHPSRPPKADAACPEADIGPGGFPA